MDNRELLLMIGLIKMEYKVISVPQIVELINKEFNKQIIEQQVYSLLYPEENYEVESKLIEYYA